MQNHQNSESSRKLLARQPNPDLTAVFFLMDSVSLGIADDQIENWNFVSVEQFKISAKQNGCQNDLFKL